MPTLHIESEPRLAKALVASGALPPASLLVVDVGASGGVERHWAALGAAVRHVAFEPDAAECARLNAAHRDAGVTYHPCALGGATGTRPFYVRTFGSGCSFYRLQDLDALRRFFPEDFVRTLGTPREVLLDVLSYDDFAAREGLPPPDFMKLDCEGAELEILEGATAALDGCFGVCVEVRFDEPMAPHAPFWQVDRFLQARGFRLFDLDIARYARIALPQPWAHDYRDAEGRPYPGPTIHGKPQLGDALYFRDAWDELRHGRTYGLRETLKACALYELYGFPDWAAELLLALRDRVGGGLDPAPLLDLLVPEVCGERLSYAEHVRSLTERPERFRPRPPSRAPGPRGAPAAR